MSKNSYNSGPWYLKKGEISDYIRVTETNRKHLVVLGRILYVIEESRAFQYCGYFIVEPCFMSGWWMVPFPPFLTSKDGQTHMKHYQSVDINREEWMKHYNGLITKLIQKGDLYIKQSDPILKFYRI